jgi:CO dehydrogenase maturation factor
MKIAVSGKGGVGKTTLAAAITILMAEQGNRILAIDADPDSNLASALGAGSEIINRIVPISQQIALIEERTGAKVKQYGQLFKLNPEVSDIADKYTINISGVDLLVLGAVDRGGSGCACPENVLLRALVTDLILYKKQTLVIDMEAGIEHLGRATAKGVDLMIIVVEPGQHSIDSTFKIIRMANEIGIKNIKLVANKVNNKEEELFIQEMFPDKSLAGIIPYSEEIRNTDRTGLSVVDNISDNILGIFYAILENIKKT